MIRVTRGFAAMAALCILVSASWAERQFVVLNLHDHELTDETFARLSALVPADAAAGRDVGAAAIFSYLAAPVPEVEARLRLFLELSAQHNRPVVVQLDGEQWWQGRPDLWNWWAPDQPGYDPANRHNVEWTGWGPEHAVRLAWRNWGRQHRVLPPPNLMSPAYRAACHEAMRQLVPVILDWWQALPLERRDLLIGIKVGWESGIGVNAWHYPNGNALADQPEAEDPTTGTQPDVLPSRGVAAIGYAAVTTAGLASEGPLQEADLAEVTQRHLEDLSRVAAELGVPRDRLFTHAGGWADRELLYDAAVNPYACPGWSFYTHGRDPTGDTGVMRALARGDAPYWAAVEWLPLGAANRADWLQAMRNMLASPRCRFVTAYNWLSLADNAEALAAITDVVREPPPTGPDPMALTRTDPESAGP